MERKRHEPDEIVTKLRQVDVLTAQGQSYCVRCAFCLSPNRVNETRSRPVKFAQTTQWEHRLSRSASQARQTPLLRTAGSQQRAECGPLRLPSCVGTGNLIVRHEGDKCWNLIGREFFTHPQA
jgi:hypothetical protein